MDNVFTETLGETLDRLTDDGSWRRIRVQRRSSCTPARHKPNAASRPRGGKPFIPDRATNPAFETNAIRALAIADAQERVGNMDPSARILCMCNRYVTPDEAAMERYWHIGRNDQWRGKQEVFPRQSGPFVRAVHGSRDRVRELIVGRWGLIPSFAKSLKFAYSTNNARFEGIETKASFKRPWTQGQRCIIPAWSFDEPCWETGCNVWWRFRRADGVPWGLAGLWNEWTDPESGEILQTYTMLTINADEHPLMSRMHKPDPKLSADRQDKRSVVSIELADVDQWLYGSIDDVAGLVRPPPVEVIEAAPGH